MREKDMDPGAMILLNVAKYGGYAAVLWVTLNTWEFALASPVLALLAAVVVDSVRNYYVEDARPRLAEGLIWLQIAIIYLFLWLDGTGIGAIPLVIMIAESGLMQSRRLANRIFGAAVSGFLFFGILSARSRGTLDSDRLTTLLVNAMFFLFAYGVSLLARMQREERTRAEVALADLEKSRAELEKAYERLMENSRRREDLAVLEERNRMARDVHDTLGHSLTGIIVGLEAAGRLIDVDTQRARAEIARIQASARSGLEEVRRSLRARTPRILETGGFQAAVRGLIRDMGEDGPEINLDVDHARVPERLELPLYRVVQEAITNALRHGQARRIWINLTGDDSELQLDIFDDGRGVEDWVEGYGLRGMRERVEEIGGDVQFISRPGEGFRVRVRVGID
ncbi:MAG: sensor histidine kinase [Bacillota bacterium]